MKIKLDTHTDMSALDNDTLDQIITCERELFGYRGYGEYAFCTNGDCRRIQSIDEVFGVSDSRKDYKPLDELEKDGCDAPDCPDCESPSLLVFDPEHFRPYLLELYRNAYGVLLRDEEGAVRGASIFQEMEAEEFFRDSMDYKETFVWDDFRERAQKVLGIELESGTRVIATNRLGIQRPYRGGNSFLELARTTANIKPENDEKPAFAAVRFDGNALPMLQSIGFRQIASDDYGTVAIGIPELGIGRSAVNRPDLEFAMTYGPKIMEIAKKYRVDRNAEVKPKYYKGVALLDRFQAHHESGQAQEDALEEGEIGPDVLKDV